MYTNTSVAAMCTSDEFQDRILASVVQTLKHQIFASVVQTLKHHSTRLDHPENIDLFLHKNMLQLLNGSICLK